MPHGDWGPHPVTALDLVRAELAFAGCDGWCYAELIDRPGTGLGMGVFNFLCKPCLKGHAGNNDDDR